MDNKTSSYTMKVDLEFKELCDEYAKKIEQVTWNAVDYSYKEITKILTRKIKEAKLV
jgi:hypothetical protein